VRPVDNSNSFEEAAYMWIGLVGIVVFSALIWLAGRVTDRHSR
jgi:hypothetical protein